MKENRLVILICVFDSSLGTLTQWEAPPVTHWLCSFKCLSGGNKGYYLPLSHWMYFLWLYLPKPPKVFMWSERHHDSLLSDSFWTQIKRFLTRTFITFFFVCDAGHNEERCFVRAERESTGVFCEFRGQTVTVTLPVSRFALRSVLLLLFLLLPVFLLQCSLRLFDFYTF